MGMQVWAQCDPEVPSFIVDLSNNPDTVWQVPDVQRDGSCCGAPKNTPCVRFEITLHPDAGGINFGVCEGAEPSGALYYQIGCGDKTPVGQPICINDPGPHILTFCKPGKNENTFCITSIPKPSAGDDITIQDGCNGQLTSNGFDENNISWTSVLPGNRGSYDHLLSCIACLNPNVNLSGIVPDSIVFEVSGFAVGECGGENGIYRDSVTVFISPAAIVTIEMEDKILCTQNDELTLNANISGGTPPYNIVWSNGNTGSSITVGPGTYYVQITDALNCRPEGDTIVVPNPNPINTNISATPVTCNGGNDGSATVVVSGGYPPYQILWDDANQQQSATAENLNAGYYTVTVTDSAGCEQTANIQVAAPNNPLTVSLVSSTNVSCKGGADGTITVNAQGGTAPYNYEWSHDVEINNPSVKDLPAGTYTVTVTDANGCVIDLSITINEPSEALNANITQTNALCFDEATGSITAAGIGGTAPYQYRLNSGGYTSNGTFSNLAAGTYNVTVRDAKGCLFIATVNLSQPESALSAVATTTPPKCWDSEDGEISLQITGGTAPYSIKWNDAQQSTSNPLIGLKAGTYRATITDANACTFVLDVTLTAPSPIQLGTSTTANDCNGGSNGQATVNPSGGTPPYRYLWSDPNQQNTQTATGLAAGSYTITVFDNNDCAASRVVNVGEPASPISASTQNIKNVSCFGANDGSASIQVSGGTPPYNISWNTNPVQNGAQINNLSAGSYTATVTDSRGCVYSYTVTITQPNAALSAQIIRSLNPSCFGLEDGSALIGISGGKAPYTVQWNDPQNQSGTELKNVGEGSYTAQITDANNCTFTISVSLSAPPLLTLNPISKTDIACKGEATGSATAQAAGGTAPYTYQWNDSYAQTGANAENLLAGTYTVTATDANGCTATGTVTLGEPNQHLNLSLTSKTDVKCQGDSSGTATVLATGGTAPYSYIWSDSKKQSTRNASGLAAGSYTVTVTDSKGCKASLNVSISQPTSPVNGTISVNNHVSCHGFADGSASVNVSGGASPYSIIWSPSNQAGANASNLALGLHQVDIQDANGCTQTLSVQITQPQAPLAATVVAQTNVSCYDGENGMITASVTGGTAPYSYQWDDPNQQTGPIAVNLRAGTYTLTVTDKNGCTVQLSGTITEPSAPLTVSSSVIAAKCKGTATGEASVTPTGGTAPYTYQWNDPSLQSESRATELLAGEYLVTVKDAMGCQLTVTILVTEPAQPLQIGISSDAVSCNGLSDGSASATANGGISPYQFSWNDPQNQTGPNANNLPSGEYQVSVLDANGCLAVASIAVPEPDPLQLKLNYSEKLCAGTTSGNVSASVLGGNQPYSYEWNDQNGTTSSTASGLSPGTYTVTVTDAKLCQADTQITLTANVLSEIRLRAVHPTCNNAADGAVYSEVIGGDAPFTYSWDPDGESSKNILNKNAGDYQLVLTDNNGCDNSANIRLEAPEAFSASADYIHPKCANDKTGSISVTVTGGSAPYTYQWNDPNLGPNPVQNNLAAGTYVLTISDSKGCTTVESYTINEPNPINIELFPEDVNCFDQSTGRISSAISGGTTPYELVWSDGQMSPVADNLNAGFYQLKLTDFNGCKVNADTTIKQPSAPLILNTSVNNVICKGGNTGSAQALVSGGTAPYLYQWNDAANQNTSQANNLLAGSYTVLVTDAKGCQISKQITISEPASALTLDVQGQNVKCKGNQDGIAKAIVSGGISPYQYLWNDPLNQTTANAVALAPGVYQVSVTDAAGCQIDASVQIGEPNNDLSYTINSQNVLCFGESTGSATVTITAGTGPFTYQWNDAQGQSTATASNLKAGTYQVIIQDISGCQKFQEVVITQPQAPLQSSFIKNDVSCYEGNDGSATVSSQGGTAPYTYQWTSLGNQSNTSINNLSPGYYPVQSTDANGCTRLDSIQIKQPDSLVVQLNTTAVACHGSAEGEALALVLGGNPPYQYNWDNQGYTNEAKIVGLNAGDHSLSVRDDKGCMYSQIFSITQPQKALRASTVAEGIKCFGATTGRAWVEIAGGTAPYQKQWNDAGQQQTDTASFLSKGTYQVIVTDDVGCKDTAEVQISGPSEDIQINTSVVAADCFNEATGSAAAQASGGTAPYQYSWNDPQTQKTQVANQLKPGSYFVQVSDANKCSAIAQVTVPGPSAPLQVVVKSTPVSCFGGNNGSAQAQVSGGTSPYSYSWQVPNGSNENKVDSLFAGNYQLQVSDAKGCMAMTNFNITEPNSKISLSPELVHVDCFGNATGTATVTATGGYSPYTYLWNDSSAQSNRKAIGLKAGFYTVNVSDREGCEASLEVEIQSPLNPLSVDLNSVSASCFGYNDGAVFAEANGGTAPYTYNWNIPNAGREKQVNNLLAGKYTLDLIDDNGCKLRDTISVDQPMELRADLKLSHISCAGASNGAIEVRATGGTPNYDYTLNGSTQSSFGDFQNLLAGSHSIQVRDLNNCIYERIVYLDQPDPLVVDTLIQDVLCFGKKNGAVIIQVKEGGTVPYSISWNGNSYKDSARIEVNNLGVGSYTFNVKDANNCVDKYGLDIKQPQPLSIDVSPGDTICAGELINITASASGGSGTVQLQWNQGLPPNNSHVVSPNQSTTYTVNASDENRCPSESKSIGIQVRNSAAEELRILAEDSLCSSQALKVEAFHKGSVGPYQYIWNPDIGKDLGPYFVDIDSSATFTLSIVNACNDTLSASHDFYSISAPELFIGDTILEGCAPLSVYLVDTVNADAAQYQYLWNLGDGNSSTFNPVRHLYQDPGVYNVSLTITNPQGCSTSSSAPSKVVVKPSPFAFAEAEKTTVGIKQEVQLSNMGQGYTQWLWNLGPNGTSSELNPVVSFADTGTYQVYLELVNQFGCMDVYPLEIKVRPTVKFKVPTGFTPDPNGPNGGSYDKNDLSNNVFYPLAEYVNQFHMQVYNRWGELVFESHDINIGWDGYYKGKLAQQDVYIWRIRAAFVTGEEVKETGNVTLIWKD